MSLRDTPSILKMKNEIVSNLFNNTDKKLFEHTKAELTAYIIELQKANEEIARSRRAAFNLVEDAVQSKEALRKSEERLQMAVESGNIGTCDWNYATGEMQWNDVLFRLTGIPYEERLMDVEEFYANVHSDDVERTRQNIKAGIEGFGTYTGEYRVLLPGGDIHWIYEVGRVVERQQDKPYRVICVLFDITGRKKLEQQKEDFISIASHELKTPVTSIKAYTELLQEMCEEADYENGGLVVKKLASQVDRLMELVHSLLDATKMIGGPLPLNIEQFDLKELIAETAEDLGRFSKAHRINLLGGSELIIWADRERISQVLNNIISNAIKYSPNGGEISINWKKNEKEITVTVRDSGIGISEEAQARVFERFYREKTEKKQNSSGMGLGLYISADIIYRHGGDIGVESKTGQGSTFYFTLPVNKQG